MFFRRYITGVLRRFLEKYIGTSSESLTINFLKPSVFLSNVEIDRTLVGDSHLFCVKGTIRSLQLKVPWTLMYRGKCELIIHDPKLEIFPQEVKDITSLDEKSTLERGSLKSHSDSSDHQESDSTLFKYAKSIIQNISVTIYGSTVTFLDVQRCWKGNEAAVAVSIEEICCKTSSLGQYDESRDSIDSQEIVKKDISLTHIHGLAKYKEQVCSFIDCHCFSFTVGVDTKKNDVSVVGLGEPVQIVVSLLLLKVLTACMSTLLLNRNLCAMDARRPNRRPSRRDGLTTRCWWQYVYHLSKNLKKQKISFVKLQEYQKKANDCYLYYLGKYNAPWCTDQHETVLGSIKLHEECSRQALLAIDHYNYTGEILKSRFLTEQLERGSSTLHIKQRISSSVEIKLKLKLGDVALLVSEIRLESNMENEKIESFSFSIKAPSFGGSSDLISGRCETTGETYVHVLAYEVDNTLKYMVASEHFSIQLYNNMLPQISSFLLSAYDLYLETPLALRRQKASSGGVIGSINPKVEILFEDISIKVEGIEICIKNICNEEFLSVEAAKLSLNNSVIVAIYGLSCKEGILNVNADKLILGSNLQEIEDLKAIIEFLASQVSLPDPPSEGVSRQKSPWVCTALVNKVIFDIISLEKVQLNLDVSNGWKLHGEACGIFTPTSNSPNAILKVGIWADNYLEDYPYDQNMEHDGIGFCISCENICVILDDQAVTAFECLYDFAILVVFKSEDSHVYLRDPSLNSNYISGRFQVMNSKIILDEVACSSQILPSVVVELRGDPSLSISVARSRDKDLRISVKLEDGVTGHLRDVEVTPVSIFPFRKDSLILIDLHLSAPTRRQLSVFPFSSLKLDVKFIGKAVALHVPTIMGFWRHFDVPGSPLFRLRNFPSRIHFSNRPSRNRFPPERSPNSSFAFLECRASIRKYGGGVSSEGLPYGEGIFSTPLLPIELVLTVTAKESVLFYPWNESDTSHNGKTVYLFGVVHKFGLVLSSRESLTRLELSGVCGVPRARCSTSVLPEDDPLCTLESLKHEQALLSPSETAIQVKLLYTFSRESNLMADEKLPHSAGCAVPKEQLFLSLNGFQSKGQHNHASPCHGIFACFSPQEVASFIAMTTAKLGLTSWKGPGFQPPSEAPRAFSFSLHLSPVAIQVPCLGLAVVLWDGLTFKVSTLMHTSELRLRCLSCILHESLVFRGSSEEVGWNTTSSKPSFDAIFCHLKELDESEYAVVKVVSMQEKADSDSYSMALCEYEKKFAVTRLSFPSRRVQFSTCTLWAVQTGIVTITENLLWTMQKIRAVHYLQVLQELVALQREALVAMAEEEIRIWGEQRQKKSSPPWLPFTSSRAKASSTSFSPSVPVCPPVFSVVIEALHIRVLWKSKLRLLPEDSTCLMASFHELQYGEAFALHKYSSVRGIFFPDHSRAFAGGLGESEIERKAVKPPILGNSDFFPCTSPNHHAGEVCSLGELLPVSDFHGEIAEKRVLLLKEGDASLILVSSSSNRKENSDNRKGTVSFSSIMPLLSLLSVGKNTVDSQSYSVQHIPVLLPFCVYPASPSFGAIQPIHPLEVEGGTSIVPVACITKISSLRVELTRTSYLLMYECVHRISDAWGIGARMNGSLYAFSPFPLSQEVHEPSRGAAHRSSNQSQTKCEDTDFPSSAGFLNPDGASLEWVLCRCPSCSRAVHESLTTSTRWRRSGSSSGLKKSETAESGSEEERSHTNYDALSAPSLAVTTLLETKEESKGTHRIKNYKGVYIEEIRVSVVDLLYDAHTIERSYWEVLERTCQEEKRGLLLCFSQNHVEFGEAKGQRMSPPCAWFRNSNRRNSMKTPNRDGARLSLKKDSDEKERAEFATTMMEPSLCSLLFNEERVRNNFQDACNVFGESMGRVHPLSFQACPSGDNKEEEEVRKGGDGQGVSQEGSDESKKVVVDENKFLTNSESRKYLASKALFESSDPSYYSRFSAATQEHSSVYTSSKFTTLVAHLQCSLHPFSGKENQSNCLKLAIGPVVHLAEQYWMEEAKKGPNTEEAEKCIFRGLFIQTAVLQLNERPSLVTARQLYYHTGMPTMPASHLFLPAIGSSDGNVYASLSLVENDPACERVVFPSTFSPPLLSSSRSPPHHEIHRESEGESPDSDEYPRYGMRELLITVDAGSMATVLEMLIESPARVLEEVERSSCGIHSPAPRCRRNGLQDAMQDSIESPDQAERIHSVFDGYSSFSRLHRITGESWTLTEDVLLGRQHVQGHLLFFSHADTNHLTVHLEGHTLCLDSLSSSSSPAFRHPHYGLSWKDHIVMIIEEGLTVTFIGGAIQLPFEAFRRAKLACKRHTENQNTAMEEPLFWSLEFLLRPYIALGEGSFFDCKNVRCIFGQDPRVPPFVQPTGSGFLDEKKVRMQQGSSGTSSERHPLYCRLHLCETRSCASPLAGIPSQGEPCCPGFSSLRLPGASQESVMRLRRKNGRPMLFSISTFSICGCPLASQTAPSFPTAPKGNTPSTTFSPPRYAPGQCILITGSLEVEWKSERSVSPLSSYFIGAVKSNTSVSLQNVKICTVHAHRPNAGWSASDTTIVKNWSLDVRLSVEKGGNDEHAADGYNESGKSGLRVHRATMAGGESKEVEDIKGRNTFLSYHLALSVGELKEVEVTYQDVFLAMELYNEIRELYMVKRHLGYSAVEQEFLQLLEEQWGKIGVPTSISSDYVGVGGLPSLPSDNGIQHNEKGYSVVLVVPKILLRLSNHRSPLLAVGSDALIMKATSSPIGVATTMPEITVSSAARYSSLARQGQRSVQASGVFLRVFGLGSWDDVLHPTTRFHYQQNLLPSSQHAMIQLDGVELVSSVNILRKVTHVQRQLSQVLQPPMQSVKSTTLMGTSPRNINLPLSTPTATFSSLSPTFHFPHRFPLRVDTTTTPTVSPSVLPPTSTADLHFGDAVSPFYMPPQTTSHCMLSSLSALSIGNAKGKNSNSRRAMSKQSASGSMPWTISHDEKAMESEMMSELEERGRRATALFSPTSPERPENNEDEETEKSGEVRRKKENTEEESSQAKLSPSSDGENEPLSPGEGTRRKEDPFPSSTGLPEEGSFSSLSPFRFFRSPDVTLQVMDSASGTESLSSRPSDGERETGMRALFQRKPLFTPSRYTTSTTPTTHCFVNSLNQAFYLLLFPVPREKSAKKWRMRSKIRRKSNEQSPGGLVSSGANDEDDNPIPVCVSQLTGGYELVEVSSMAAVSLSIPYKRNEDLHVCVLTERCVMLSLETPREWDAEEGTVLRDEKLQHRKGNIDKDGLRSATAAGPSSAQTPPFTTPPSSHISGHRIPHTPNALSSPPTLPVGRQCLCLNLQEAQSVDLRTAGIRLSEIQCGVAKGLIVDDLLIVLSCTGSDEEGGGRANFKGKTPLRAGIINGAEKGEEEADVIQVRMHAKTTLRNETGCTLEVLPCNTASPSAGFSLEPPPRYLSSSSSFSEGEKRKEREKRGESEKCDISSFCGTFPEYDPPDAGITLCSGDSYAVFDICNALIIHFEQFFWVYEATLLLESSTNSSFLSLFPKYRAADRFGNIASRRRAEEENDSPNGDKGSAISSFSSPLPSQWENTLLVRDNRLDQRPVIFYVAVELVDNSTSVNIVLLPRVTVVNAVGLPLRFTLWQTDPLAGPPTEVDRSILEEWRRWSSDDSHRCHAEGELPPMSSGVCHDPSRSDGCRTHSVPAASASRASSSSSLVLIGAHSSLQHEESLSILQCTSACDLHLGVAFTQPTGEVISTADGELVRVCKNVKHVANSYSSPPVVVHLRVQMRKTTTASSERTPHSTHWKGERGFNLLVTIRPRQIIFSVAMWVCNMTPYSLRLSDSWWSKKMVHGVNEESGIPPSDGAPFPLGVLLYRFDTAFLQIGLDAEWSAAFSPVVGATGVIESMENTLGIIRSCNYTIYFPNAKDYQPAVMLITPRWVFTNLTSKRLRVFLDYPGLEKMREMAPPKKRKKNHLEKWVSQEGRHVDGDGTMLPISQGSADVPSAPSALSYHSPTAVKDEEISDALEASRVSMVTAATTFYLKPDDAFISCVGPVAGNCIFLQEDLEGAIPSLEVLHRNGKVAHRSAQHVGMFFNAQRTDAISVDAPGEKRFNLWASPAPSQAQLATWHGATVMAYPKAALLPFFQYRMLPLSSSKKSKGDASSTAPPRSREDAELRDRSEKDETRNRKIGSRNGGTPGNESVRSTKRSKSATAPQENARSFFSATPTSLRSTSFYSSRSLPSPSLEELADEAEEEMGYPPFASSVSSSRSSPTCASSSFLFPSDDAFSSCSSFSSATPAPAPPPPATLTLSDHSYGSAAVTTGRLSVKVTPGHNNMLLVYIRPVIATQICIHNRTLEHTIVVRQEGSDRRSFIPSRQNRYFCWEEASGEHVLLVHQLGWKGVWYRVDFTSGECVVRYEQSPHTGPRLHHMKADASSARAAGGGRFGASTSDENPPPPFYVSTLSLSTKTQVTIIITSTAIHPSLRMLSPHLHTVQSVSSPQKRQERSLPFSTTITSISTVLRLSSLQIQHHFHDVRSEDAPDYRHSLSGYEHDDEGLEPDEGNEMEASTVLASPRDAARSSSSPFAVKASHTCRTNRGLSWVSVSGDGSLTQAANADNDEPLSSPGSRNGFPAIRTSFSPLSPTASPLGAGRSAGPAIGTLRTALLLYVVDLVVESVEAGSIRTSRLAMTSGQMVFQQFVSGPSVSGEPERKRCAGSRTNSGTWSKLNRPIVFRAVWKPPASFPSGMPRNGSGYPYRYRPGVMNALFARQPVNINKRYMIEGHYSLVKYPDGMQRITEGAAYFAPLMISVQDTELAHFFRELHEVQELFTSVRLSAMRSATFSNRGKPMGDEIRNPTLPPGAPLAPSSFLSLSAASAAEVSTRGGEYDHRGLHARSTLFSPANLYPSVYLSQIVFHGQVEASQAVVEEGRETPQHSRRSSVHRGKTARSDMRRRVGNKRWNAAASRTPQTGFHRTAYAYPSFPVSERPVGTMKNGGRRAPLSSFLALFSSPLAGMENDEEEHFLRIDSLRIDCVTVFVSFVRDPVKDPLRPFFGSYTLMLPNRMDQTELSLRAFSLNYTIETMESLQGKLRQWCQHGLREQWAKLTKLGAVLKFLKRSGRPSLLLRPSSPLREKSTPISSSPVSSVPGEDDENAKKNGTVTDLIVGTV